MAVLLAFNALAAALLIDRLAVSLTWPLIRDAPLLHYVAWLMQHGAVPYRDVFDYQMPGSYLLHWSVLTALGPSDWAWRVFDLGWLAATAVLVFAFCRRMTDAASAAAAALTMALYHLGAGSFNAGERDYLMCLPLLAGAYGVARAHERGAWAAPLLWGGAALGAAVMIKPYAAVFLLCCALAAAGSARRQGRPVLAAAALVLAGRLPCARCWRGVAYGDGRARAIPDHHHRLRSPLLRRGAGGLDV